MNRTKSLIRTFDCWAKLDFCFVSDEMDCGVEQIDGPARTLSPSCEQRDAGREGEGDADSTQRVDLRRPRIKLPQRSDMICGFASLKGQKISKFAFFPTLWGFIHEIVICINQQKCKLKEYE